MASRNGDESVLRHFKTVLWGQAYRTQDVVLLDRLLHDDFEMIDAEGNRSTKQDELDDVRENAWDPGEFEYRIERPGSRNSYPRPRPRHAGPGPPVSKIEVSRDLTSVREGLVSS
jgi:hypothetical protein